MITTMSDVPTTALAPEQFHAIRNVADAVGCSDALVKRWIDEAGVPIQIEPYDPSQVGRILTAGTLSIATPASLRERCKNLIEGRARASVLPFDHPMRLAGLAAMIPADELIVRQWARLANIGDHWDVLISDQLRLVVASGQWCRASTLAMRRRCRELLADQPLITLVPMHASSSSLRLFAIEAMTRAIVSRGYVLTVTAAYDPLATGYEATVDHIKRVVNVPGYEGLQSLYDELSIMCEDVHFVQPEELSDSAGEVQFVSGLPA